MILQLQRPLIVFDLETTGINPRFDRIVEFGALKVHPTGRREELNLRVHPQRPIPPEATAVHGITDADVADCPPFKAVAEQVVCFLTGADLAGFSLIRFDIPLLKAELARAGAELDWADVQVVDAQRIFHMREPRNLSAALMFYCGEEHVGAHGAAADCEATWQVLLGQCQRYADLPRTVDGLHDICNPRDPDQVDDEGKLRWRAGEVVIAFGQKSGIPLRELAAREAGYLKWMLNKDFSPVVKKIVQDALQGTFPTR